MQGFTDVDAFLASQAFDLVIIATPHYFHTTQGVAALEAGYHVLVEKPISVHKQDCEKLIAAHTDKTKIFAAMFNQRTDPAFLKLRDLIQGGELGELRRVNWIITNWFRTESYYQSSAWRATWKGEGGGVLLNQCPHQIDLLQWMCGMPTTIRAQAAIGKYHDIEVEDDVTAFFEWPNGATGVFITSTGEAPGTNRLEIVGERGRVVLENDQLTFTRNESAMTEYGATAEGGFDQPDTWNIEIPLSGKGSQHQGIMQNVVNAIRSGEELISPAAEGIHSVELANTMLYAGLTGETVTLPLDSATYATFLQKLGDESTHVKKVVEKRFEDMSSSFNK